MTREQALDINWLKANAKMIHFFGLGFIQIKINDEYRVHIYTDKLPSTTEEDVHNHRYDFESTILKGIFYQTLFFFEEDPAGDWLKIQESCNPNNKVESTPAPVKYAGQINMKHYGGYEDSDHYVISHDQFHRVRSTNAVTLVKRGPYKKDLADVVYKRGTELKCPFSVKATEEQLWSIVEEALK